MASLVYYDSANPGKKRKLSTEERKDKKKQYEKNRPDRSFNEKWKNNRSWLVYDREMNQMSCSVCCTYEKNENKHDAGKNLKNMNTFISGCVNFRLSSVEDHEKSVTHKKAHEYLTNCSKTVDEKSKSDAGKALNKLKSAEKGRLMFLFRNAHAIAKNNRPLSDYSWLCRIDQAKEIDIATM